jgi:alpha-tubulin suppressor-like RCC1 family protein
LSAGFAISRSIVASLVLCAQGVSGAPDISAGASSSFAVNASGVVRSWGDDSNGQLGIGRALVRLYAMEVFGIAGVTSVSAGYRHSVAITTGGYVATWGNGQFGQLGDGSRKTGPDRFRPGLSGVQAVAPVATRSRFGRRQVLAWGSEGRSAGRWDFHRPPQSVIVGSLAGIRAISARRTPANLALKSDGTVWA